MTRHDKKAEVAGAWVKVKPDVSHPQFNLGGTWVRVEDWWDHLTGKSWMFSDGNPAAIIYALRTVGTAPIDDEVLYAKHENGLGVLVHVSELEMDTATAEHPGATHE